MSVWPMRLELTGMVESPGLSGYIHAVCPRRRRMQPIENAKAAGLVPGGAFVSGGCSCRVS